MSTGMLAFLAVIGFLAFLIYAFGGGAGRAGKSSKPSPPPPDPAEDARRSAAEAELMKRHSRMRERLQSVNDDVLNDPAEAAKTVRRMMKR